MARILSHFIGEYDVNTMARSGVSTTSLATGLHPPRSVGAFEEYGSRRRQPRMILLLALVIGCLSLLLRLPGLGEFMTVDEENWMLRSAEYWDVLLAGNPGGTFLTTHPGSTVMWLVGAGETLQEQRLGFQVHSSNLQHFRKAATAPVVVVSAILIAVIVWLLGYLWTLEAAGIAGLLLAADPYLLGMTQIAHLDGLQALLMLASLLAFFRFVWWSPRWRWLVVAGGLLGLAMGVKLVLAFWLLPIMVGVALMQWGIRNGRWRMSVRVVGFVTGMAALVFFAGWPALWVKDDVGHSITRDVGTVITDEHVALSATVDDPIAPISFYGRTVLGRTTPYVQILSVGTVVLLVILSSRFLLAWRSFGSFDRHHISTQVWVIAWLLLYGLGFLVLITLAAKKGDRYALPALVVLPVVAGWAVSIVVEVVRQRFAQMRQWLVPASGGLIVAVIAVALLTPYPSAYNNPFFPNIRPLSQQGWGEGLDEVARWLNKHPLAQQLYVASWYRSVTSTYFAGKTFSLSSRDDYRVSYVVTYRNMAGRASDDQASDVLDEFRGGEPVYTASILGVPYAWVYETLHVGFFTKHIGELVSGMEMGQTVTVPNDTWDQVAIGFATFSSRGNTAEVVLHVRETPDGADVRTVRVNAQDIVDNEWHTFRFEPITGAMGKEYYIAVTSPDGAAGNAVTVRYIDADLLPGEMYLLRQPLRAGESRQQFKKVGDIAYRLPG